jgi:hypothetical protein
MNEEQYNFQIEQTNNSPEVQPQEKAEQERPLYIEAADALLSYLSKKEGVQEKVREVSNQIQTLVEGIKGVREKLGLSGEVEDAPSIDALKEKQQNLIHEQVEVSANYPGDWTTLLMERMLDPITKQKFVETRTQAMQNMKLGEAPPKSEDGLNYAKEKEYQAHYQKQIDEYDANVHKIFNKTHIGESSEYNKQPHNLGKGEIGFEGAIFTDGEKRDGTELTTREKNIIESHEKGHGLRDFVSEDGRDFRQSIDFEVIRAKDAQTGVREIGYLREPDEIAERMAQLKNYFGMKAKEIFTKEHLEYAKQKYIKDIGLDNNMTTFFEAITKHTIDKFIETINRYPL